MEQGLDNNAPPTSYRDTFRRHRKLFCLPIILGALVAGVFVFATQKSYKSTASLWVDTTPPAQSSIGAGSSALVQPPASAEGGILSELLTTGSFASAVAQNSLLGKSLGSVASIRQHAAALLGTGQVVPIVEGNQVLQISYTASSPAMATSVLAAIIAQLQNYTDRLTSQHNRDAVASATEQLKAAETALATARGNVASYKARRPKVTQADPNYAALVAAENNAVARLGQANAALGQVAGAGNAGGWLIHVIDPPTNAGSAGMGKKKIVEIIFGGAMVGLLVSFLAVIALTPAKKEVWEDELPKEEVWEDELPNGKHSFGDAPSDDSGRANPPAVPTAFSQSSPSPPAVHQRRLSTGERRFSLRNPSAPIKKQ
jgi:uncharacterized protein involved in exopolysaccharide biosynthesis